MTPEQARAYKRRYELVEAFEREELRRTPVETKFRQLCALAASVDAMGWREALEAGDDEVRRRWQRIRPPTSSGCAQGQSSGSRYAIEDQHRGTRCLPPERPIASTSAHPIMITPLNTKCCS